MNYFMHLYIFFKDQHIEHHIIERFSDLSQDKSQYYYYEKPIDQTGKGTCFKREDILCFEITPRAIKKYDEWINKK